MSKKVQIFNYIPHHTPKKNNIMTWYNNYERELMCLYSILKDVISERYQQLKIDWNSNILYESFIRMIYSNSSKYISG